MKRPVARKSISTILDYKPVEGVKINYFYIHNQRDNITERDDRIAYIFRDNIKAKTKK